MTFLYLRPETPFGDSLEIPYISSILRLNTCSHLELSSCSFLYSPGVSSSKSLFTQSRQTLPHHNSHVTVNSEPRLSESSTRI